MSMLLQQRCCSVPCRAACLSLPRTSKLLHPHRAPAHTGPARPAQCSGPARSGPAAPLALPAAREQVPIRTQITWGLLDAVLNVCSAALTDWCLDGSMHMGMLEAFVLFNIM